MADPAQNIWWVYSITMRKQRLDGDKLINEWVTEKRFYKAEKLITDFDVLPIEGKRKDFMFIGLQNMPQSF